MASSRLPGFHRLPLAERRLRLADAAGIPAADLAALDGGGLDVATADHMIENVVGLYALPFAVATNFQIDGEDRLVPMAVEEPSIVAAAGSAARLVRAGGGFTTEVDAAITAAQVELVEVGDPEAARARLVAAAAEILAAAAAETPRLVARGGGPRRVEARVLSRPGEPDGGVVVVHIDIDCGDAMGANLVNTVAEAVAPRLAEIAGGGARPALRILSNLADRRRVRVRARVPAAELGDGGEEIARLVAAASRFAELDPYRAATHNKGIMNGVDAVLVATGNDWRGVEAGAHAYAARGGVYAPLAIWRARAGVLEGELEMPMAVGTVGGALRLHAGARLALRLGGVRGARDLAALAGAAGLATNLSALRALATTGIQRGHMALHARSVARAAGATGSLAARVAEEISAAGDVKLEKAREILARLRAAGWEEE